jgi:LysR family transcriptional activator of nhaA
VEFERAAAYAARDMTLDEESLDRLSLELDVSGDFLNFRQLYYFHAVAMEGSLARAARRLGVATGTISEQLKNLEAYLHVQLFDRSSGTLRLNGNGRRIFDYTRVMFRTARRLVQDISPSRAKTPYMLEIGICPTISHAFTSERLLPLLQLNGIALRIRHAEYDELLRELLAGDIDLVLTENRPAGVDERKIGVRPVRESPLVWVAAPELARNVAQFPADLARVPLMQYVRGSRYHVEIEAFLVTHGIVPVVIAESDHVGLMISAARRGLCAVAVPARDVVDDLECARLVALGRVAEAQSTVYAQYQEVAPVGALAAALDALRL